MGLRGGRARPAIRKPGPNQYANARYRTEIVEGDGKYWDLVLGDPVHWADPLDPEREAAWRQWAPKIFARWSCYGRHGDRPSAYLDFELPALLMAAVEAGTITMRQVRDMSPLEAVYAVDADKNERHEIQQIWMKHIRNVGAARARKIFDVPQWFIDKIEAVTPIDRGRG
jgi:hypothetical protein